jgi:hypothetical protein
MNIDSDFNYLGDMPIESITSLQTILPEIDWLVNTMRQELFNVHQYTNTVVITEIANASMWNGIDPWIVHIMDQNLYEIVYPIIKELENKFNSKIARSMLILLPAGKKIPTHPDSGHYLMSTHRCHLPIQTNPDVMFTVGKTTINMKVGQGYEINNAFWHSVDNNGTTDRVHLLVDLLPNDYEYDEARGTLHPRTWMRPKDQWLAQYAAKASK